MVVALTLVLAVVAVEAGGRVVVQALVEVVAEHELLDPGALAAVASAVADVDGFWRVGPQAAIRRETETDFHNVCFATTCVRISNVL